MRQLILLVISLLLFTAACSTEQIKGDPAKPDEIITDTSVFSGAVVAIDQRSRMVTLRDKTGSYTTCRVDSGVKSLDRVQKGDRAVATCIESFGIRVIAPGQASGEIGKKVDVIVNVGLKEGKPYSITARIVELKAVVDSINYRQRHVAIRGRKGNIISFRVGKNIKRLGNVKKGDTVVIYYTEPVAVLLEKTKDGK